MSDRGTKARRPWSTAPVPLGEPLLDVVDLTTYFPITSGALQRVTGHVQAVDGVSFSLRAGETLGVVGESGCGKSTTARTIAGLLPATSGQVVFKGQDISGWDRRRMKPVRRDMQMVFQDPFSSLNPRLTAEQLIAEPLRLHGLYDSSAPAAVLRLMERVGLSSKQRDRYASEFSGGQRQRLSIARALALQPQLLILDEPVSALDVSIQAQIVNLLIDLQKEFGLSYIFVAHDLSVVRHISDRVAVMYLGRVVEEGTSEQIFGRPLHPYTQALLSAVPVPDPARRGNRDRIILHGAIPSPADPPSGCRFRTRCWKAVSTCAESDPLLEIRLGQSHPTACHFSEPSVQGAPTTV